MASSAAHSSPAPTDAAGPAASLLDGVRVVDLCGEAGMGAGRILGDLGADVVRVTTPPSGGPGTTTDAEREAVWSAGTHVVRLDGDEAAEVDPLLAGADIVLDTPHDPGSVRLDPTAAPGAVWVSITPFGLEGPRADWHASDLGVMASSGNMFATGDPDRAPLRCAEPTAYAHTAPEAAVAALTGLASRRPQHIDLSMQETVLIANIGAVGRWQRDRQRGQRRGANIGRTREIWPCRDGYVSFGIRGGKARIKTWAKVTELIAADGIDVSALEGRDWGAFNHNTAEDDELEAIQVPVGEWFARHTMSELYGYACDHSLTLAPINSPREILASAQLEARGFFESVGDVEQFPAHFVTVRSPDNEVDPVGPTGPATTGPAPKWPARATPDSEPTGRAWEGTTIVEFGSGAAGPIASRYFAEHGATVVRVEARSRPDFLRAYALGPKNPHGLDGAPMFDSLNVGKLGITLDLKHDEGRDLALRLIDQADGVLENFAPKAMRGLGLDYDTLVERKPDLVMISACLNGQTGPHKDYPGFGSQGAALAGFNHLTGWPDREPVGPYGTITDSLAPRYVAAALAAGLLYRQRTGKGVHLDLSQVEAGHYALSPWLVRYATTDEVTDRMGNRSDRAAPHGAFPCQGKDRWVAIACWSDDEWRTLAGIIGFDNETTNALATLETRLARVDEVEQLVADWTSTRDAAEVAELLQGEGIEAVPVQDFEGCFGDPQLAEREHLVELTHPKLGESHYERNGFRLSDGDGGYDRPSTLLGEHTEQVLSELLGLSLEEIKRLEAAGALD